MGRKNTESTDAPKAKKIKVIKRIAMSATLGLCIPEALNKKIEADAKKKKMKKSALVRMILESQYGRKTA